MSRLKRACKYAGATAFVVDVVYRRFVREPLRRKLGITRRRV